MFRLAFLLLFYLPFGYMAPAADPIDNTAELIKAGNIKELAKTFASSVELTILADENIATPAQAEAALTNFFKTNPVKSVTVVHRVNSNANIRFAVLNVVTANGTYRTSISLKLVNGQFALNEFRIEADKK